MDREYQIYSCKNCKYIVNENGIFYCNTCITKCCGSEVHHSASIENIYYCEEHRCKICHKYPMYAFFFLRRKKTLDICKYCYENKS